MFKHAIVKRPCKNMVAGITSATLGKPDYNLALTQHDAYIRALEHCGLTVDVLPADENFPDSTFVEDAALLTTNCAVITRPGAIARRDETKVMKSAVKKFYSQIEEVSSPGTLDAGDVMMAGDHFYIGLSERTNRAGAGSLITILEKYGFTASTVTLREVLHLKTGVAYLENDFLVATGEFLIESAFQKYNILEIPVTESYAANCIWINDHVLIPAGYPEAKKVIQKTGYEIIEVDTSEFRKLDGGLSCLSLRF